MDYTQQLSQPSFLNLVLSVGAFICLVYAGFQQDKLNDCCNYANLPLFYRLLSRLRFTTIWFLLVFSVLNFSLEISVLCVNNNSYWIRILRDTLLCAASINTALWSYVRSKFQEKLKYDYIKSGVSPEHTHHWQRHD